MITYLKLPNKIKMKLSGNVLVKYEGAPYILDLGAGVYVNIQTGDYVSRYLNEAQNPFWLSKNPDKWETG